ncbi:hypothetical protein M5689_011734 [Euphorbia peplus]|nr:hypothetical protein M5689_011734 [Euphorbia peplus]
MKLPMPIYPNQHGYSIVGSCNGLLCLRPKGSIDNVIICNLTTKNCLMLPASTSSSSFMPWRSYQLGFHFDSSSMKYKVVREFQFLDNLPSKFQLITVGENSWKDLTPPNYIVESGFGGAIFWNEGFHWKLSELANGHGNDGILRFDLMEEKFTTILFTGDNDISQNFRVSSLRGELKIVEHHHSRFLKIWKVTENNVEGFSLSLQYTYDFCVPPSKMLQYKVVDEIDEETYLMHVNTWNRGINRSKLEIFYPRAEPSKLEELTVASLPNLFKIISYKPSLCSPIVS